MPHAIKIQQPIRPRPTRAAVDPSSRSRWIEAFYVAEAKAALGHQAFSNQRRSR